jgi:hypothetical protein
LTIGTDTGKISVTGVRGTEMLGIGSGNAIVGDDGIIARGTAGGDIETICPGMTTVTGVSGTATGILGDCPGDTIVGGDNGTIGTGTGMKTVTTGVLGCIGDTIVGVDI